MVIAAELADEKAVLINRHFTSETVIFSKNIRVLDCTFYYCKLVFEKCNVAFNGCTFHECEFEGDPLPTFASVGSKFIRLRTIDNA